MTSFYFYDLETSGTNPRSDRIMQFAGQRTDMNLNPIGEPHNILIALSDDVLPNPEAIMITGITPQHTQAEGTTEADFLKSFNQEVAIPGTIFVGYNTVRFDDEFMRCLHYRNFYDPYAWQWKDDRSRWDLLDVVRMTRALRPDGIMWPIDETGKATNRLELITKLNGLDHANAHDALNDVLATIAVAKLLRQKQPKLFDYLLTLRSKKAVQGLVTAGQPFVYSSGKYPAEFEKTTVVQLLTETPKRDGALVYDLRHDPTVFAKLSASELAEAWQWLPPAERSDDNPRLPIKTLKYNRCPAIAPLSVLDGPSQKRLQLDLSTLEANSLKLKQLKNWPEAIQAAVKIMDAARQKRFADQVASVDGQIYDGFVGDGDQQVMEQIRSAEPTELSQFAERCQDQRLKQLLPLYKARNYPRKLTSQEKIDWEEHRLQVLGDGSPGTPLADYFAKIEELMAKPGLSTEQKYLLEDLNLYGQSLIPSDLD